MQYSSESSSGSDEPIFSSSRIIHDCVILLYIYYACMILEVNNYETNFSDEKDGEIENDIHLVRNKNSITSWFMYIS